jgi:WD40 repeat protein
MLASAESENETTLWDVETGRPIERLGRTYASAVDLTFSPDGKWLAVARGAAPGVQVFDLARAVTPFALNLGPSASDQTSGPVATSVLFTPDGRHLIVGGNDGSVHLFSMDTGDELLVRLWEGFGADAARKESARVELALSSDGETLAALADRSSRSILAIWPLGAVEPPILVEAHFGGAGGLVFLPDGRRLYTSGNVERHVETDETTGRLNVRERHGVRVWDAANGDMTDEYRLEKQGPSDMVLLPDGKTLALKSSAWGVRLIDAESGAEIGRIESDFDPQALVKKLAVSPDGRLLATTGPKNVIGLWNLATRAPAIDTTDSHAGAVRALAFTPDGKTLLSAGRDLTIRAWDAATGEPRGVMRADGEQDYYFRHMTVSPNGVLVAAACRDGVARVWEIASGRSVGRFDVEATAIQSVAFSPDGAELAISADPLEWTDLLQSGGRMPTEPDAPAIEIWSVERGERINSIVGVRPGGRSLWFLPPGDRLLGVDRDGVARIWDRASGVLRFRFETGVRGWEMNFALTPNGKQLVTLRYADREGDGELVFWDVETGEPARRLPMPGDAAREIALTPDGRRAVVGSVLYMQYTVLDVATGRELGRIRPPRGLNFETLGLAIAPDGRSVAIGLSDGTSLIYPMPPIP